MKNILLSLCLVLSFLWNQEVVVWVSDADESHIELSMTNTTGISGFQFTIIADPTLNAEFGDAYGGAAEDAGFMMSTNADGLVLGFSMIAEEIAPGDSVLLTNLNWSTPDDAAGYLTIELIPNSFTGGNPPVALESEAGNPYLYGDNIVFGCTDPDAINFDPDATVDDGSCVYPPNPPLDLTADGGYTEISLEWDYEALSRDSREQITVYVSEIQDDGNGHANILIYLDNPDVAIYGFQFKINTDADITLNSAFGGRADLAEFMVVTNEDGQVLGFSMTGGFIAPGSGTMTILDVTYPVEQLGMESVVSIDETYDSNMFSTIIDDEILEVSFEWVPVDWIVGEDFINDFVDECGDGVCTGDEDYFTCPEDCPPPEEITFNIYRDGSLYESGVENNDYIDSGLGYLETYCYTVTAFDGAYESDQSNEACTTTDPLGADIDVTPDFLFADIFTGDSEQQSLTITNSGDDNLVWTTTIEEVDNVSRNAFNPEEIKRDVRIYPDGEIVPGELIVRYGSETTDSQRELLTRMLTITREKSFDNLNLYLYHYESDWKIKSIIAYLNSFENVLYAEPSYKVEAVQTIPDDPFFNEQWGMHNIGQSGGSENADLDGPEAWDVETGNGDIVVGIIDTGVDYNHEDLQGNIWTNSGEIPNNGVDDDDNGYVDDYYGYDFANYDPDPWDDNGHGTHCAGVVTAAGDNGIGVAGVNWNAKVAAIKFLDSGGGGSTEGAIEAILYANMMGLDMTSNSWGGGPYSEGLKDAIEAGEILFIAAAGNYGNNNDANPFYPATYNSENVISVAAINRYDQLVNEGWWGSNYGLTTVDVAAAGLDVFSTFPPGAYLSDVCNDNNGDGYGLCSGTSMATPHVAGVAALALGRNPEMDWMLTKQIVMDSAIPTPGLDGYCMTGGRVNAYNAVIMVQPQWIEVIPENGVVPPGSSMDVDVVFNAEGLFGGEYQANINFESNDPVEPVVTVGTLLSVTGAPNLAVDPTSLDFGDVFVDGSLTLEVNVTNNGTDLLNISSITSDNGDFTTDVASLDLNPEDEYNMQVTFAPSVAESMSGVITMISNDPGNPEVTVSLTGTGILPPDISVTPDSFAQDLFTGDIVTETLLVTNDGSADLIVDLSVEQLDDEMHNLRTINTADSHYRTAAVTPITNNDPHTDEVVFRDEYSGDYLSFGISDYGEILPLQFDGNEFLAVGAWISGYTIGYVDANGVTNVYYAAYDSWNGIYPLSYTELVNDDDEVVVEVITQTDDDAVVITRTFTFERSEKFVQIHTEFENISGSNLQGVVFKSFADWDIDNSYDDDSFDYDVDRNMVYAWDNNYGGITAEYVPAYMDLDGWGDYQNYDTFVDYPDGPITFFDGFGISHFEAGDLEEGDSWEITTAFVTGESLEALQESADEALNYISTDWLSVEPENLVIPSGVTEEVTVTFNAEGLYGGEYNANILLENNDPDESTVVVPAFLSVTGAPNLAVDPTSLDFGDVFVNGSLTLEVNVTNNGTDLLSISSITSDNGDFTTDVASLELNPEDEYNVQVTFAPSLDGGQTGTIILTSNDPGNPEVTVSLTGTGILPPDISVDPLEVSANLFTGDIESQILTIINEGDSDLDWNISTVFDDLTGRINPLYDYPENTTDDYIHQTNGNSQFTGSRRDLGLVAIIQDFDPWGVAAWQAELEAREISYEVRPTSDLLTMDYSEYDMIITSGSNNVDTGNILDAADLIYEYVDNGGIAAVSLCSQGLTGEFGDISFEFLPNDYTYILEPDHPLVTGVSDPSFGTSSSHTYFTSYGEDWSALTVSEFGEITSVYKDSFFVFGLTLEHAYLYFPDDLGPMIGNTIDWAMELELQNEWLSVDIESGSIPAGESQDVQVTFDATGLNGGEYNADIVITTNDPDESTVVVPAFLSVTGAPNLAVDSTSLDFGDVFVDGSLTLEVNVTNNGTDLLSISSITSDNGDFTTDVASLELNPEDEYNVQVTFAPSLDGGQTGTIILTSNDPGNPEVAITVTGNGQLPPVIEVTPMSISAELYTGDIDSSQSLTILNSGFSPLDYNIEIDYGDDDDNGGGELAGLLFENNWWLYCEDIGAIEYWWLQEDGTFWICESENCNDAFQPGYWEFEDSTTVMTGCYEGEYSYNFRVYGDGSWEDFEFDIFITMSDDQTSGTGYHYFEYDDYEDIFGIINLSQIGLTGVTHNSGSEISIWEDLNSGRLPTIDLSENVERFNRLIDHNAGTSIPGESANSTSNIRSQDLQVSRILPDVNRNTRDLPSVLVLNTYIYEALPWISELDASVVDTWEYDAPLDVLLEYDVVIVGSNYSWTDPTGMGDILAEYVDGGGSLIILAATFHGFGAWALGGLINTPEYNPLQHTDYSCCADTQFLSDPVDHPIWNDVNDLWTNLWAYTAPQGSGISIGSFGNGYDVGAYNPDKPIISFNIFANGSINNGWFGGDFVQLMNNSLDHLSGSVSDWLSVSPESGSLEDGSSDEIMVTFDATGLYGGEYNADIVITSNDPDDSQVTVPAFLSVTGAPNLAVEPTGLDFGDVFVDGSLDMIFTVRNDGTDALEVYDISSGLDDFIPDISSVTLEPEDSQIVTVTFTPTVDGDQAGVITITSNDPGTPEFLITISGTGLLPPDIETEPDSLSVELFTGDMDSSQTVTITNVGFSELIYTINVETSALSAPSLFGRSVHSSIRTGTGGETILRDTERQNWSGDHITDNSETLDHLDWLMRELPDSNVIFYDDMEAGENDWTTEVYTIDDLWHQTESNFNSPTHSWWCGLEGSGTYNTGNTIRNAAVSPTIDLSEIDSTVTLQFYENYETEAGWDYCMVDVSIDGGLFWEPLRGEIGEAPSGSSGGWISSSLDLTPYAGSQINLRFYFDTGDNWYNDYHGWFFDDVVIYTNQVPWLDVSEDSGTLAPGESDEITVYFDAGGLFGGDYYGEVQIFSNDPDESTVVVPAFLSVTGAPGIAIDPVEVYFDTTAAGDMSTLPVVVTNTGTDLLVVTDIFTDNEAFSANPSSFSVEVNENMIVNIQFSPETSGLETGTLVIESNDPSNPEVFLSVSGLGIVMGCTDPDAINYNPDANIDDGSCIYRPNAPEELTANPVDEEIQLYWDYDISETNELIKVFISEVIDDGEGHVTLGLNMVNEIGVSGWQFMLDPGIDLTFTNAYGGRAEEANHLISFNTDGLILGFSMDLSLIEPGDGVLIYMDAIYDVDDIDFLAPLDHIFEDEFGNRLTVFVDELGFEIPFEWVVTHWQVGSDILITTDVTFNVYRNDDLIAESIPNTGYTDSDVTPGTEYCYVVFAFDGAYESEPSNTACAEIEISTLTQSIDITAFSVNMISGSVMPEVPVLEEVFMENDVLIMSNDGGGFFVPNFGINSIGDWSESDGYQIFLSGAEDQVLNITGEPVDPDMSILIQAFTMNMIPYYLQEPMSSIAAFGNYDEDILLVKDDSGNFYVPEFGIYSLETLNPGEGYAIFLSSNEDIVFDYTGGGDVSRISENTIWEVNSYQNELEHYQITPTGLSYPVILHSLSGVVESGDELAVYAHDIPVGAVKITSPDHPVVIPAWEGFSDFGVELPGFSEGDEIKFRLWSASESRELRVEADISNTVFGDAPLTSGTAMVYNMSAVPEEYSLSQPYPNPFNATTRIQFALSGDTDVQIIVYDMLGKEVTTLVNEPMETGYHTVLWNADQFSSGLYFIHFTAGGIRNTQKVLLIK